MTVLYLMIPVSLLLGFGFVLSFVWSVNAGQLDDTITPAQRMLDEEDERMIP